MQKALDNTDWNIIGPAPEFNPTSAPKPQSWLVNRPAWLDASKQNLTENLNLQSVYKDPEPQAEPQRADWKAPDYTNNTLFYYMPLYNYPSAAELDASKQQFEADQTKQLTDWVKAWDAYGNTQKDKIDQLKYKPDVVNMVKRINQEAVAKKMDPDVKVLPEGMIRKLTEDVPRARGFRKSDKLAKKITPEKLSAAKEHNKAMPLLLSSPAWTVGSGIIIANMAKPPKSQAKEQGLIDNVKSMFRKKRKVH